MLLLREIPKHHSLLFLEEDPSQCAPHRYMRRPSVGSTQVLSFTRELFLPKPGCKDVLKQKRRAVCVGTGHGAATRAWRDEGGRT